MHYTNNHRRCRRHRRRRSKICMFCDFRTAGHYAGIVTGRYFSILAR